MKKKHENRDSAIITTIIANTYKITTTPNQGEIITIIIIIVKKKKKKKHLFYRHSDEELKEDGAHFFCFFTLCWLESSIDCALKRLQTNYPIFVLMRAAVMMVNGKDQ